MNQSICEADFIVSRHFACWLELLPQFSVLCQSFSTIIWQFAMCGKIYSGIGYVKINLLEGYHFSYPFLLETTKIELGSLKSDIIGGSLRCVPVV
jgi:hypothetical protein